MRISQSRPRELMMMRSTELLISTGVLSFATEVPPRLILASSPYLRSYPTTRQPKRHTHLPITHTFLLKSHSRPLKSHTRGAKKRTRHPESSIRHPKHQNLMIDYCTDTQNTLHFLSPLPFSYLLTLSSLSHEERSESLYVFFAPYFRVCCAFRLQ